MLYAIKNNDALENLNELVSLENEVQAVRLQDYKENKNFMKI